MRWLTCTPVSFSGGDDFFARDTGLLSRGFRELGVESSAVMPLPAHESDLPELVRAPMASLEDAGWWEASKADGVVLYAWGHPAYRRVAAAIRDAGIFLVLNQDSCGVVSPLNGPGLWLRERWSCSGAGRVAGGWPRFIYSLGKGLTLGLARTEPMRAMHLRCGHVIAAVSPAAAEHYRRLCRFYGGTGLAGKVEVIPHPVSTVFHPGTGEEKENTIIAVGRWDDERQKRTSLLTRVMEQVLRSDEEVRWVIVGKRSDFLDAWHASQPEQVRQRVLLTGVIAPTVLAGHMRRARVSYCSSAFESFHISSAEALCSGCSVVGPDLPGMSSFRWFCSEECGTLAGDDSVEGHGAAVLAELGAWSRGDRDALKIGRLWGPKLHAPAVAAGILELKDSMPARDAKS